MSRLKLKSITLRNFCQVRRAKVDFPSSGFIFVTGQNLTGSQNFESIGSGKTTLGFAISKGLFGVTSKWKTPQRYSFNKKGDTYVLIEAELDGKPLIVEFGYKCSELSKTGEGLRYTIGNSVPVMYGSIDQTRSELSNILMVKPSAAPWTIFVDGDAIKFDDLSEKSAVGLLMDVLNQPPWEAYHKKVDEAHKSLALSFRQADGALNEVRAQKSRAQDALQQAQAQLAAAEAEYGEAILQKQARSAERQAKKKEQLESLGSVQDSISRLKKLIEQAIADEAAAFAEKDRLKLSAMSELQALQRGRQESLTAKAEAERELETYRRQWSEARSEHARAALAELNATRIAAVRQVAAITSENSRAESTYRVSKASKEGAVQTAQARLSQAEASATRARNDYSAELNSPAVCPLAGCGKTWPKDNAQKLSVLKIAAENAEAKLVGTQEHLKKCQEELSGLVAPVPKPLPEVPAEVKQAPPFPLESDWSAGEAERLSEITRLSDTVESFGPLIKTAEASLSAANEGVKNLKQSSSVPGYSAEVEKQQREEDLISQSIHGIDLAEAQDIVSGSELSVAQSRLNQAQAAFDSAASLESDKDADYRLCSTQVGIAKYWVDAFSPQGIPNLVIRDSISPLNLASRKISSKVTGGLLEVSYSTTKRLASGEAKNEITVVVDNPYGASDAGVSSKGESGLLNFITAETLAEVGNIAGRIGYRWYDEIVTSQDQRVRKAIFEYIKDTAIRQGILAFVVDHSPEAASYADHTLVAVKTDQGTTYKWM